MWVAVLRVSSLGVGVDADGGVSSGPIGGRVLVGVLLCAGLVAGLVSPAWGEDGAPAGPPSVALGSFAVGDGVDAMIGERDGSVAFQVAVGGVSLSWDSRSSGVDRHGLGERWGLGLAQVSRKGGLWVFPSSGGSFEASVESPSGLSGYPGRDVVFRVAPEGAMLPARPDGAVGERPVAYELHELGGVVTSFDEAGDPIGRLGPDGSRTDWLWGDDSRLESVVDADGVETALSWSGKTLTVTRGVNVTGAAAGAGAGGVWRVELQAGRVSRVLDPVGGLTEFRYNGSGLLDRIEAPSGADTVVEWQPGLDAVARVSSVRVLDAEDAELSSRTWSAAPGSGSVSGWPVSAGAIGRAGFGTTLSDGVTRIESEFDGWGLLTGRRVVTSTGSGEHAVQEQEFSFPDRGAAADPALVPAGWSRPESVSVTYRDASGATRTGTESLEFDDVGRMVRREAADGRVTERTYDEDVAEGALLPIGLPTSETVTSADGLVASVEYGLSEDRKTPVSVRTLSARPGEPAVVTGLTAYTVEAGRVTAQEVFPGGDESAAPVVTTWDESTDLVAGEKSVTETIAAGTPLATSVSSVTSLVHGGTLSSVDASGRESVSTFDLAGRPLTATDAAGRTAASSYRPADAEGVTAATVTGPDGVSVTEERDELGRLVRAYDDLAPTGQPVKGHVRVFESRAYPAPGVVEVTDAWGATTRTESDVFGRPGKTTLPNGLVQVTKHDDVARTATAWASPTGAAADAEQTVTRTFDDAGRATRVTGTRADGVPVPEVSSVYDGLGRQVSTTDGVTETKVTYDAAGNPVRTSTTPAGDSGRDGDRSRRDAPASVVAERRFDAFGASLEKTVASGDEARSGGTRELDVLGRPVVEVDQAGVATRVEYTPDGLVERTVSDTGRETAHTYDERTRALVRTEVSSPAGASVTTEYGYDDQTGRLLAVWDPADVAGTRIGYEYDGFGNVTVAQYPSEVPGEPGKRVRHVYDEHGRKTATIDVAGNRTDYAYDEAGFLTEAVQHDASGKVELARVGYGYDALGRVDRIARGNGVTTAMTYTSTNQVETETTTSGEVVQSERVYEYDPATGNLTARVDRTRPVGDADAELAGVRTEYRYDTLGHLIGSTVRDGDEADASVESETSYEVNGSGQVTAETVTTSPGTAEAASTTRRFGYVPVGELETITTVHPDGRAETVTQEWDAEGNLVRGVDGTTFGWDAANRRISETRADGTTIETAYWADGMRKELTTTSGQTRFYWDGDTLLNDTHRTAAGEAGTASYLLGATRHARTTQLAGHAAVSAYYGSDRHGNVTDLTNASGQVTATYRYTDYGVPTTTQPRSVLPGGVGDLARNPFGYSGEYAHDDSTQFLTERILDPGLLGFQSKDREALHNVFGYANANPIMMVDPSGRDAVIDWVSIGLAAYGAFAALSGVAAIVSGGASLGLFGIAAAAFGTVDGVFTALEAAAVLTDQKFMPDEASLAIGIGLAVVGTVALGGGVIKGARAFAAKRATAAARGGIPDASTLVPKSSSGGAPLQPTAVIDDIGEQSPLLPAKQSPLSPKNVAESVSLIEPADVDRGPSGLPFRTDDIPVVDPAQPPTPAAPFWSLARRLHELRTSILPMAAKASGATTPDVFLDGLSRIDKSLEKARRNAVNAGQRVDELVAAPDGPVYDSAKQNYDYLLLRIHYDLGQAQKSLTRLTRSSSDPEIIGFVKPMRSELTRLKDNLDDYRF
jgi:RHS repeat-associated protein